MPQNPKILLVDDNAENIKVAAEILRNHGYNVSFAQDGSEALAKAKKKDFDLIVLDIMMSGMDGFQVCTLLKNNPQTNNIPIIFLTGRTDSESVLQTFNAGGADYVTKPFNSLELLSRVEAHIKIKNNREKLETLNAQLIEANEVKDKMFSIISHDLLGPLGNIKESIELIATDQIEMERQDLINFVKAMRATTRNTYDLLENLLYWARNQQGKMIYRYKQLNLNHLVNENLILFDSMAQSKNIKLKSNIKGEFSVFADRDSIKTILRNLISNALKFTNPDGTITIDVKSYENDFIEISVADDGIGMDEETCSRIFSKFKNESRWGTKGEKGIGLGLVIAREFVEKHNGKIWVKSKLGEGSTFYFTLPTKNTKYEN